MAKHNAVKMTHHHQSLSLHMTKKSKPVGRFFKKKDASIKKNNHVNFKLKKGIEKSLKQNTFIEGNDSVVKSNKSANNKVPSFQQHSNGISKVEKPHAKKFGHSSLPLKSNMKNNQPRKRNIDDVSTAVSPNSKIPKKALENSLSTGHAGEAPHAVNQSKSTIEGERKPNKKKKGKKKNKKKTSENAANADSQYKPVLIVREPKDISANWKNLKDVRSSYEMFFFLFTWMQAYSFIYCLSPLLMIGHLLFTRVVRW